MAIARALITDPAIMLASEPTSNLDTASGEDILKLLCHACDEKGQTIVMATYDPQAVEYADRIVRPRDGRIEEI